MWNTEEGERTILVLPTPEQPDNSTADGYASGLFIILASDISSLRMDSYPGHMK